MDGFQIYLKKSDKEFEKLDDNLNNSESINNLAKFNPDDDYETLSNFGMGIDSSIFLDFEKIMQIKAFFRKNRYAIDVDGENSFVADGFELLVRKSLEEWVTDEERYLFKSLPSLRKFMPQEVDKVWAKLKSIFKQDPQNSLPHISDLMPEDRLKFLNENME
ncbi:MAG: hypothetical protein ACJAW3_000137 [Lentimonas sp.]